jgi:hypothetical protein
MEQIISYGIGRDYLPNWGMKEALREIYQNFIDFKDYSDGDQCIMDTDNCRVNIWNQYVPNELDFLRIGMSNKNNDEAIGTHGEGLKMAFLIFLRENLFIKIITQKYTVEPIFINNEEVGEIFALKYSKHNQVIKSFIVEFDCPIDVYNDFKNNIIKEEDIIFNLPGHGSIVNKPKGNIYSGTLFVCNLPNLSAAYNILPSNLPLDRDRAVPKQFDINWHTSKIQESYGKWKTIDTTYNDLQYVSSLKDEHRKHITPVIVGNSIEFISKNEEGLDVVIKNQSIKDAINRDSFFESMIKKLKLFLIKSLGLYDLLVEFEKKHVHTIEARQDFQLILEHIKNGNHNK